jgi:hypothetical protein
MVPEEIVLVGDMAMNTVGNILRKKPKKQFAPHAIEGVARRA